MFPRSPLINHAAVRRQLYKPVLSTRYVPRLLGFRPHAGDVKFDVELPSAGGGDQRLVLRLRLRRVAESEVQQTLVGEEIGRVRHVFPAVFHNIREIPEAAPRQDRVPEMQNRAGHDRSQEKMVANLTAPGRAVGRAPD